MKTRQYYLSFLDVFYLQRQHSRPKVDSAVRFNINILLTAHRLPGVIKAVALLLLTANATARRSQLIVTRDPSAAVTNHCSSIRAVQRRLTPSTLLCHLIAFERSWYCKKSVMSLSPQAITRAYFKIDIFLVIVYATPAGLADEEIANEDEIQMRHHVIIPQSK